MFLRVLKLLFSGPHNVVKHNESHGEFILTWMPSENQDGEDHPVCFLVQAEKGSVWDLDPLIIISEKHIIQ